MFISRLQTAMLLPSGRYPDVTVRNDVDILAQGFVL